VFPIALGEHVDDEPARRDEVENGLEVGAGFALVDVREVRLAGWAAA
jgi:hypothetical protein